MKYKCHRPALPMPMPCHTYHIQYGPPTRYGSISPIIQTTVPQHVDPHITLNSRPDLLLTQLQIYPRLARFIPASLLHFKGARPRVCVRRSPFRKVQAQGTVRLYVKNACRFTISSETSPQMPPSSTRRLSCPHTGVRDWRGSSLDRVTGAGVKGRLPKR